MLSPIDPPRNMIQNRVTASLVRDFAEFNQGWLGHGCPTRVNVVEKLEVPHAEVVEERCTGVLEARRIR